MAANHPTRDHIVSSDTKLFCDILDFILQRVPLLVSLESWLARSVRMTEIGGNMSVMLVCEMCFPEGGRTGLAATTPASHKLVYIEPELNKISIIKNFDKKCFCLGDRGQYIFVVVVSFLFL